MKKTNNPTRDPFLKSILQQYEIPGLPEGFSTKVMSSVRGLEAVGKSTNLKIPLFIKIGIPAFILICAVLIVIFPGNSQDPLNLFLNDFSLSGISDFFARISDSLQSYELPEVQLSKKSLYYLLGGIGLVWMFVLSEGISRKANKR